MTLDRRKPGQAQPYCPRIASALAADGWRRNPDGAMAQLAADGLRPTLAMGAVKDDFFAFFCFSGFASLFRRISSYIIYVHGERRASGEAKPARHIPAQTYNPQQEGAVKMQDSGKSMVKAMKAVAAQTYNPQQEGAVKMQDSDKRTVRAMKAIEAQAKAIVEVFQVSESVALRIVEERIRQILEIARGCAGTDSDWALSAIEALSAGCKCGEGACKAKEEAQAPVPVRKPAAPEAAPKATDGMIWLRNVLESVKAMALEAESKSADVIWLRKMAESVRAMELEASPIATDKILVGSQNRVTIPAASSSWPRASTARSTEAAP